jgi:hypothetical protein
MEARSEMSVMPRAAARLVAFGALGGVLAGLVLAVTEMIYGWATSVHTAWDAPMAIWAWIVGLNHFGQPGNHIGPILLGLGTHMVISMIAGVVFVAVLATIRLRINALAVVLGIAYGLVLWVITRYGLLPLRDSTKALFTTSMVSPQWVWWLAHGLFGLTLGTSYAAVRRARMLPVANVSRMRDDAPRMAA